MSAERQENLFRQLQERKDGLVVLESGLMIIINFLAFTGNMMVCWAVYRNQRLRTLPNIYVVTLAISDALMAVLCMPMSVVLLITGQWPFSGAVCQFQGFFAFSSRSTPCYSWLQRQWTDIFTWWNQIFTVSTSKSNPPFYQSFLSHFSLLLELGFHRWLNGRHLSYITAKLSVLWTSNPRNWTWATSHI